MPIWSHSIRREIRCCIGCIEVFGLSYRRKRPLRRRIEPD
jgi:hypothetical protein